MHHANSPPDLWPAFSRNDQSLCRVAVQELFPDAHIDVIDPLARVWDEVVDRIVRELMDLASAHETELHINVREDMILELAKLQFSLAEAVIKKRTEGRELTSIDRDC